MLTELWQTLPNASPRPEIFSSEHSQMGLIQSGYCIQSKLVLESYEAATAESLLAELDTTSSPK
jgi:hypothetical protein